MTFWSGVIWRSDQGCSTHFHDSSHIWLQCLKVVGKKTYFLSTWFSSQGCFRVLIICQLDFPRMSDPREPARIISNALCDLILKPHTIISSIFSFKKQEFKSCQHWRGGELGSYFWREEHKRICGNVLNHKINLPTIPLLGI